MANIIDFGKRNIGNILKVAAGLGIAALGVTGAMRSRDPDEDDYDEDEIEELEPADDESDSPEEATDDGEG